MASELDISKALEALETGECSTIAAAARLYEVSYYTLYERYRRNAVPRIYAHESQMALNKAQEEAVVRWIAALTTKSCPPIYPLLRAQIGVIQKLENPEAPPLGKNYLSRFIKRHAELGAAISNRRDKRRALRNPRPIYEDFFQKVASRKCTSNRYS